MRRPLDEFQDHAIDHFTSDTLWPWFERLQRRKTRSTTAPRASTDPIWSITRYADIVACESDVARRSSSSQVHGGITLFSSRRATSGPCGPGPRPGVVEERANFIALDPPRHDAQRKVVAPMFSTPSLAELEPLIRSRAGAILDGLPIGETFDGWTRCRSS